VTLRRPPSLPAISAPASKAPTMSGAMLLFAAYWIVVHHTLQFTHAARGVIGHLK
jgi:hypothetical protein